MEPARRLRDVFAELAVDGAGREPDEVLRASGHAELPEPLVAEAVVSYADTAPHEVAEHLAPFVRATSAVPLPADQAATAPSWIGLLSTAPRIDGGVPEPEPEPELDMAYGQGDAGADGDVVANLDWGPLETAIDLPELDQGTLGQGTLDQGALDHGTEDGAFPPRVEPGSVEPGLSDQAPPDFDEV